MKLSYSKKILILSLVVFAGILILDLIFTNLLLNKIVSINDKVKQLNISSREREKELILKDSIVSSKLNREKLVGYFVGPGNVETVEFTEYLEDLALKTGVTQEKSLGYEPIVGMESSEVVSTIRFRFSISGKWENVFSFLQAIENLPKVAFLNSASLSVNSESASRKIWSATLDFSVVKLKI